MSRFLTGLIPTTAHHHHVKVDVTLQTVLSVTTASVNKLICDGVFGLRCIFTSLRGFIKAISKRMPQLSKKIEMYE